MTLFFLKKDYYRATINGIQFLIHPDNLHETLILYAERIAFLYSEQKNVVLDYVIEQTGDFYLDRYSREDIKKNLQNPCIEIIDEHFGVVVWANHKLDEHIIECEFIKDLELSYVTVDG